MLIYDSPYYIIVGGILLHSEQSLIVAVEKLDGESLFTVKWFMSIFVLSLIPLFLTLVTVQIMQSAAICIILHLLQKKRASLWRCFAMGWRNLKPRINIIFIWPLCFLIIPIFSCVIFILILASLAFFLGKVPEIMLFPFSVISGFAVIVFMFTIFCRLFTAVSVSMIEKANLKEIWQKGQKNSTTYRGKIIGLAFMGGVISFIFEHIIEYTLFQIDPPFILTLSLSILIWVVPALFTVFLPVLSYVIIRQKDEGTSVEEMSQQLT